MLNRLFGLNARAYVLAAMVLSVLVLSAALGLASRRDNGAISSPAMDAATAQSPVALAQPATGVLSPVNQSAVAVDTNVTPATSRVPSISGGMSLVDEAGGIERLQTYGLALVILGAIGAAIALAFTRRRWAVAIPIVVVIAAAPAVAQTLPAFAGAATATRWELPHTFAYNPFAIATDAPNDLVYFAEDMIAVTDGARIGQLNLQTNDLVEWETTTDYLGPSMAVVGFDVFYTQPAANIIGRLDPTTDTFTRWQLPTAGGDAAIFWTEPSGKVWYVSHNAAKIGRLNAFTNDITEWTLAVAGTPIKIYGRDDAGDIWFALPAAAPDDSKIGRLNVTTNNLTLWPLPASITEQAAVMEIDGNTVWFSGVIGVTTLHVGRLDTVTNEVTRWTIWPTNTPGIDVYPQAYYQDAWGNGAHEISVSNGRYRQTAMVDSTGLPWFIMHTVAAHRLIRLDPASNQLLEFDFGMYKLLGIDANDVISALSWSPTSPASIVYFDTTTDSQTMFATGFGITLGYTRFSETEFWLPVYVGGGQPGVIERVVITP